jgi:transcriptional regulator GlxA family with amidase domain
MNSRLVKIEDWDALAAEQRYKVAAMARRGGFSKRALERYFQKNHSMTPKQWCMAQRMKKAKALLSSTRKSVKEIAADLQFQSVSHFCQAFRHAFGISPHSFALRQHRRNAAF